MKDNKIEVGDVLHVKNPYGAYLVDIVRLTTTLAIGKIRSNGTEIRYKKELRSGFVQNHPKRDFGVQEKITFIEKT